MSRRLKDCERNIRTLPCGTTSLSGSRSQPPIQRVDAGCRFISHIHPRLPLPVLDTLIGPLPQAQSVYDSRSPLNHLEGFKAPLIVFQGADDPVVPPNQSAAIVEALRARKIPLAYLLFPGEGHGFRKPENIVRSLQSELSLYGQVFGFTPADELPPLAIEHMTRAP